MGEVSASRYMVQAGWDDVPHLDDKTKRELLTSTMPYLRDARSKGTPSLGSGAIYPISDEYVTCDPFAIPAYWPRAYGMDVGWNRTAAIWVARDPSTGVMHAYSEYYRGQAVPLIHAEGVKARGAWIKGAIDPAARGRGQGDGQRLLTQYKDLGLKVYLADNSVESGIYAVWSRFETGRLKIFNTLTRTLGERRLYRRDERGRIVKENDHLMDALRYVIATFDRVAQVQPAETDRQTHTITSADQRAGY